MKLSPKVGGTSSWETWNVVQEVACLAGDAKSLTEPGTTGIQDNNRKLEGVTESTPIEHGRTVPAVLMQEAASLPTHSLRPGGTGTQTGNASFQKGDTQTGGWPIIPSAVDPHRCRRTGPTDSVPLNPKPEHLVGNPNTKLRSVVWSKARNSRIQSLKYKIEFSVLSTRLKSPGMPDTNTVLYLHHATGQAMPSKPGNPIKCRAWSSRPATSLQSSTV